MELGLEIGVVFKGDDSCFWVIQESLAKLQLFNWGDLHRRNLAFSPDRHRQHVVTNAFDVDCHDSLILFDRFGYERYFDLLFALFLNGVGLGRNTELALGHLSVILDFQCERKGNLRCILENNLFLVVEVVAHFSKVYLRLRTVWIVGIDELEGRCYHMAKERHF